MYRRSTVWFTVVMLALVPLLGASRPATGQVGAGLAAGFPDDIAVETLVAGEVGDALVPPVSLHLERVLMPADASGESRQVATIELLHVERGALTIVDSFGLTSVLTEGDSGHLRAGATYETRNDSAGEVSFLRLTPIVSADGATPVPMASPIADDGAADARVTTLGQFALEELPAAPVTLFLTRATWAPGVDTGPYTQNGPIGMLVESGTLTISSPSGIDGQLGEGSAVLLPADQVLSTRNDGDSDAVALLFGVIPSGGDAVTGVSTSAPDPAGTPGSASTPGLTGTPSSASTPGLTGTLGSASTPASEPDPASSPPASSSAPDVASGTVLYHADTSGGLDQWSSGAGGWQTVAGMIVNDGSSDSPSFIAAPFQPNTPDYAVEVEMQWARDGETFGIVARGDGETGYWVGSAPWRCRDHRNFAAWAGPAQTENRCRIQAPNVIFVSDVTLDNDWYTYRVEVQGNTLRLLVDGTVVIETTDNRFLSPGQVGLWSDGAQMSVRSFTVIALGDEG